jgi:hypothetical protein
LSADATKVVVAVVVVVVVGVGVLDGLLTGVFFLA